jgi:hypothetical protein
MANRLASDGIMKYQVLCEDNSNLPVELFKKSSLYYAYFPYELWERSGYDFEIFINQEIDEPRYDGSRILFQSYIDNLPQLEECNVLILRRWKTYDVYANFFLYSNAQNIWEAIEETIEYDIAVQVMLS